ncbi:phosphatase PAP2 family protein [Frankia sp. AiPs1]|uniref:phosphatase PAP2 family protein n=1 Tax=Frankia sp. AiPs1 TaxID=573493 RepID=UPI002043582C|nr:phosphatase PAP2 family protein [Frankia sp. AiPs1]MCM3925482.1 phosphatase PAP2 family protein [Frankia sp. AiPs1]
MVSTTGQTLMGGPVRPAALARGSGRSDRPGRVAGALRSGVFIVGQVVLLGSLYWLYGLGRHFAAGRELVALHHAKHVWHIERLFDLPNESSIQSLALHSSHLLEFANRFYIAVHFPAAIIFLLWVLIFQRPAWRRVRTVIMASTGVALLIHIAYPLAPPRLLPRLVPGVNLVDTGAVFGPSPYGPHDTVANQYAAMPSLHIGWSILEAWGVITILRARARWLAILHPIITTIVVVITANHYWLDGIIGGGLVVAAVQLTRPEVQARLRLWAIAVRLPVRALPAAALAGAPGTGASVALAGAPSPGAVIHRPGAADRPVSELPRARKSPSSAVAVAAVDATAAPAPPGGDAARAAPPQRVASDAVPGG